MKLYPIDEETSQQPAVAEPVATYAVSAEQHQATEAVDMTLLWLQDTDADRSDITQAITGTELRDRLRPRIKQLFT